MTADRLQMQSTQPQILWLCSKVSVFVEWYPGRVRSQIFKLPFITCKNAVFSTLEQVFAGGISTFEDDHGKQKLSCQRDTVASERTEDAGEVIPPPGCQRQWNVPTLPPAVASTVHPGFRAVLIDSRPALASPRAPAQAVQSFLHEN